MKRSLVETFLNVQNPELDACLADLGKVAPTIKILSAVSPMNAEEERRRWMEMVQHRYHYVPEFEYNEVSLSPLAEKEEKTRNIQRRLQTLFPDARAHVPVASILEPEPDFLLAGMGLNVAQKTLLRINFLRALQTGDDAEMTQASLRAFKGPTPRLSTLAKKAFWEGECYPYTEEKSYNAEQIKQTFEWVLGRYSLADKYAIEIVKDAPAISVGFPTATKPGKIKIPENRVVEETKLRTLVAHEIECHVLDRLNSKAIFHNLPRVGQEFLSEGHAIYTEEVLTRRLRAQAVSGDPFYGKFYSATYLEKALLYRGIACARRGWDFSDVATMFLRCYLTRLGFAGDDAVALEKAWNLALRVFRGCRKPNGRNALTKDCAYLAGVDYVSSHPWCAWLATGISDTGWMEYLQARFVFDESDLPVRSQNLAMSPELEEFIHGL